MSGNWHEHYLLLPTQVGIARAGGRVGGHNHQTSMQWQVSMVTVPVGDWPKVRGLPFGAALDISDAGVGADEPQITNGV